MTNEIKEILNWLFGEYPEEEIILEKYITNLQEENKEYQDKYENLLILGLKQETHFNVKCEDLQQRIDKSYKKAQLIKDIGFDYDGYNDTENLKKVIDELVNLADDIQIILRGDE